MQEHEYRKKKIENDAGIGMNVTHQEWKSMQS